MPRVYKSVSNRGRTPIDVLERAAVAVERGSSLRAAAKDFNCDRTTLKRYIDKHDTEFFGYASVSISHMVFSPQMEAELAEHIKALADQFHGVSLEKCRKFAFEFAEANKLKIPENWQRDKKAGKDWWLGFKARHNLAIRTPEATSMARVTAFNKPVVDQFYDNLAKVLEKYGFEAKDIYNLDETGCTTVQVPSNVITMKGKRQVGSVTSAERGELVTVVYTISASGSVLPPLFIFPRVNYRDHFIKGAPPGSIGHATRTGWINEDVFLDYLKHIVHCTRSSHGKEILLIIDNHESHISLQAIDYSRENGIIILTIPPHTSHRLQPLDKSVYGPFKRAFNAAMDGWLRSNPGKTVTIYEIPELVNEAQMVAVTQRNILSGFRSTGIYPFNRNLFTEIDFAPAMVTDRPMEPNISTADCLNNAEVDGLHSTINCQHLHVEPTDENLTSDNAQSRESNTTNATANIVSDYISPSALVPFPKANFEKKSRRRRGSTRIFTDTPVRNEIADKKTAKKIKEKRGTKKNLACKKLFTSKETVHSDTSSSESDVSMELDDETDLESDCEEIVEGDFVVVKVHGKRQAKFFIARVDIVDNVECEGIFLKRLPGKSMGEKAFVLNENDSASFVRDDIVSKLPTPSQVGGTKRTECQLTFKCNLEVWNIE